MLSPRLPTDTWMEVDRTAGLRAVSLQSCGAEIERDGRNQGVTIKPYTAGLVLEPVAGRMSRPWH